MTEKQLDTLRPVFTKGEIEATGAKLADVSYDLMLGLFTYRKAIGIPVWLLPGGLTTGKHEADSYHYRPEGAVDFYHSATMSADRAVEELLRAGFKGIGVYWNGSVRSFHADRRPQVTLWRGTKSHGLAAWTYDDLVKVP